MSEIKLDDIATMVTIILWLLVLINVMTLNDKRKEHNEIKKEYKKHFGNEPLFLKGGRNVKTIFTNILMHYQLVDNWYITRKDNSKKKHCENQKRDEKRKSAKMHIMHNIIFCSII